MAKWYDYETFLGLYTKKHGKAKDRHRLYYEFLQCAKQKGEHMLCLQYIVESLWTDAGKPYYKLYPAVIKQFLRVNLDKVETTSLQMPTDIETILIQLPCGSLVEGNFECQNMLVAKLNKAKHGHDGLLCDVRYTISGKIQTCTMILPYRLGPTVGQVLTHSESTRDNDDTQMLSKEMCEKITHIVVTCLLLENDPQIIHPDVLTDDVDKWKETLDPKYVEKAKRRGKFGWVIGRDMEVMPHIRSWTFALYWTGKGRTKPIVRFRSGCIVHKQLVEKIPTGYETEAEND
jgi:hypothetical protein